MARATHLATPVQLGDRRNTSDGALASRLHPDYGGAIRRVPSGRAVIRGLPFDFAPAGDGERWLLLDGPIDVDLEDAGAGSHLVIAHFCDSWREPDGTRPADLPVGWVAPVGQPLARYVLEAASGRRVEVIVRRRFEINEGIVGWGQNAFVALPHRLDEALDWRGPYPAQAPATYAKPGEAGLLGILPGTWGPAQTGVADSVPSPTGEITLWLHSIEIPDGPTEATRLRMEPLAAVDQGGGVVIAAITLFNGSASPLAVRPRQTFRLLGNGLAHVSVDLGQVYRQRPAPLPREPTSSAPDEPVVLGWGASQASPPTSGALLVDLGVAPDATIEVGTERIAVEDLPPEGQGRAFGAVTVESLPTPIRRIEVEIVDAVTGQPMPARVRFEAGDGRYLPPLGHRDEVNPGLNEDTGADVILGGATYAYVPGRFSVALPAGDVTLEVVRGFDRRPLRRIVDARTLRGPLVLPLAPADGLLAADWIGVDCHVHFVSPTSALLQARAEGVSIVNLLATQWGDHHTSLADLPAAVVSDDTGDHLVVMGSENRQNMLGHIGLLGAHDAVLPMASAGPPEARFGDPLDVLLGDWADAAHRQNGLAIAVHFPLPYAEIAANIIMGKIDAVELQALTPGVDGPSIREWYRFLNCGYRLPVVGGTDKMSAEIPLGAIRTYARLEAGVRPSFDAWAAAVRAGRTFVSSGTFIDIEVDGCGPGETVSLARDGGTVEVRAKATAAQPVIDRLELIHDGQVIAATEGGGVDAVSLGERVRVSGSGWIAARATSRAHIRSGFSTSMGAHSSPVYLEVRGRPAFSTEDASAIGMIIEGARTWVERVAVVRSEDERARLAGYLRKSAATLDKLIRERSRP